ncbi:hypothetical protein EV426DRAFT_535878, partial [Tirmania nivea]
MRNFARIILGTFTAALRRNTNQPRPTGGQLQEFNKAILCVRSLTDFYLMTQYPSHTDETVSYLRQYLQDFHETKDELVDEILKDGAHYNFPKIHLISHYAEQI